MEDRMKRAFAAFGLLACLGGASDALAQTRSAATTAGRASANTAGSVAIPINREPSCSVTREQVMRADGRLQWQTRTDCIRDPY
jgi:hypothetical protein